MLNFALAQVEPQLLCVRSSNRGGLTCYPGTGHVRASNARSDNKTQDLGYSLLIDLDWLGGGTGGNPKCPLPGLQRQVVALPFQLPGAPQQPDGRSTIRCVMGRRDEGPRASLRRGPSPQPN